MREKIIEAIAQRKLIAILRGISPGDCLKVVYALLQGGINLVEVTFNQKDPASFSQTQKAIAGIKESFGDRVYVGAGTVTAPELVSLAADAGAAYIVSPDCMRDVIIATREKGLVSIPGAMTPTEITRAYQYGADYVKLFPAGVLGTAYVKAVCAPLNHIPLLGVGGVGVNNIAELASAGLAGFGLGGNLADKQWIREERFADITALALKYVQELKLGS